jgi:SAM-dependent methyltransferase
VRTTDRPCPACGATSAEPIHRLRLRPPDGHPLDGGYDVVACVLCGTGFADITVPQSFYDRYYAECAKYAAEVAAAEITEPVAEPPWKAARLDAAAARIVGLVGRHARVLDIGCANGTLLAALRRFGVDDVRGVDPSPASARMAMAHHAVQVDVGTFSDLPANLGTFDCVCLTGVLEHVLDMDEAMFEVARLVRPDGIVYLDLPDASRYLDPYIAPFEDFSTEHVNHFSPATVDVLGRRWGFRTESAERFVTELVAGVPCAAISAVWRKVAGRALPDHRSDHELPDVLRAFARRSAADFGAIDGRLWSQLGGADRYAVWGVGEFTMKLLASPALEGRECVALADGNPARYGMRFGGVPVTPPDELPAGVPVVVGSLLSDGGIRRAIAARGMTNPVVSVSAAAMDGRLPAA